MACVRGLVKRSNLLRHARKSPVFTNGIHCDDNNRSSSRPEASLPDSEHRAARYSTFQSAPKGFCFDSSMGLGCSFVRHMSSMKESLDINAGVTSSAATEGVDFSDLFVDGANAAVDTVVSNAPAVSEVAIAAADSYLPVAALQYLIDAIHSYCGLNWWASIALTTLLIRSLTVPLLINQIKTVQKLNLIKPQLEEIRDNSQGESMFETQAKMKKLFAEAGVTPYAPLKGIFIQAPIFMSFFFAISNMAEKMPSMKTGGAYWFIDLTTPDSLYILPALTGLTFWITVECNAQEGMEGNANAGTIKTVSRLFAVASIPLTMSFPKAIFFYWITSTMFSLTYGLAIKTPKVKRILGIPEMPAPPPSSSTSARPTFNLMTALKQAKSESSKSSEQRVSSVLSQRIRTLEKQVKAKKKNKSK